MKGTARRGVRSAPKKKRRRRLGTMLVFVGLLAVLGGTFTAGALAGRLSFTPSASIAPAPKERADRTPPPSPPPPELTFYRELTAPLTPPPAVPKPGATKKPAPEAAKRADTFATESPRTLEASPVAAEAARRSEPPITEAPKSDGARYTIQVGSYNARAHADALRARLAAAGHEAYVAEGEAGGVTRYRVRIGAFPTAEDARQAAVRVASQAQVATYVTTR